MTFFIGELKTVSCRQGEGVVTPVLICFVEVKDELGWTLSLVIVGNAEYLLLSRSVHTVITYHCPNKLKGEKVYSSFSVPFCSDLRVLFLDSFCSFILRASIRLFPFLSTSANSVSAVDRHYLFCLITPCRVSNRPQGKPVFFGQDRALGPNHCQQGEQFGWQGPYLQIGEPQLHLAVFFRQ